MARPKTVTISLTPKQRAEIKKLTGEEHKEMKFERSALGIKTAPKRKVGLRTAAKKGVMPGGGFISRS